MLHHGSVGMSSEQNKMDQTLTITVTLNGLSFFIIKHVFIMIFTAYLRLSFMSVRLYEYTENCNSDRWWIQTCKITFDH